MSDIVEFEEGEIGDLSDFEESIRSQPVTPMNELEYIKKSPHFVENQFDLSTDVSNSKNRKANDFDSDEENLSYIDNKSSKTPYSLLELLSDDDSCSDAKKLGIGKKKRKKRQWDRNICRRNLPKTETPRCRFYMEGRCNKGSDCPFSHDFFPDKKQELCKFYAASSCSKGNSCQFLHGEFPCKFFHLTQNCYHGDSCKFSHNVLTPRSKALLDRFLCDKPPIVCNSDGNSEERPFVPPIISTHQQPLINDLVQHFGEVIEPRMLHIEGGIGMTPTSIPPPRFPICPPRNCFPPGLDKHSFEFGLRVPQTGNLPSKFMTLPNQLPNGPGRPPFLPFLVNLPHRFPHELPFPRLPPSIQTFRCPPPNNFSDNPLHAPFPTARVPSQCSHMPASISSETDSNNLLSNADISISEDSIEIKPPDFFTVHDDFVLPVSENLDLDKKASNWRLLPLELEKKLSYSSTLIPLNKATNDPRLVAKCSLDPRLQQKKLLPLLPQISSEPSKGIADNPNETNVTSVHSAGIDSQQNTCNMGVRRRIKLQLNEMANNFVTSSPLEKESPTSERPYLLDPRIKRRRIVREQSTENIIKSPADDSTGSTMQISLHYAEGIQN